MQVIKMFAAQKDDISEWFDHGKNDPTNTHMIIMCDTYDYEDYPVYCKSIKEVENKLFCTSSSMQRVMEVYNYSLEKDFQLNEYRAMHI